mmetsp:Transcript_14068/g.30173  ORF Transcript_14068/g.30173 Transcript_14068/m.30173 type:complete len:282 (-) Transcript_14068:1215-2060(-)
MIATEIKLPLKMSIAIANAANSTSASTFPTKATNNSLPATSKKSEYASLIPPITSHHTASRPYSCAICATVELNPIKRIMSYVKVLHNNTNRSWMATYRMVQSWTYCPANLLLPAPRAWLTKGAWPSIAPPANSDVISISVSTSMYAESASVPRLREMIEREIISKTSSTSPENVKGTAKRRMRLDSSSHLNILTRLLSESESEPRQQHFFGEAELSSSLSCCEFIGKFIACSVDAKVTSRSRKAITLEVLRMVLATIRHSWQLIESSVTGIRISSSLPVL